MDLLGVVLLSSLFIRIISYWSTEFLLFQALGRLCWSRLMVLTHVLQRAKLGSLWDRSYHKLNKFSLCFPAPAFLKNWNQNINFVRAYGSSMQHLIFQAKEELLRVIGLQEEEGSSLEFLRRGYKVHSSSHSIVDRTNMLHCNFKLWNSKSHLL